MYRKECKICKSDYETKNKDKKCCSKKCKNKLIAQSVSKYLKNHPEEWQKTCDKISETVKNTI